MGFDPFSTLMKPFIHTAAAVAASALLAAASFLYMPAQAITTYALTQIPGVYTGEPAPITITPVRVFLDVLSTDRYGIAIKYLSDNKILRGYDDGFFRPNNFVNRAEYMKMIILGGGFIPSIPTSNCFPDVSSGAWYAPYVCFGKTAGWIRGYDDGFFRPDQNITKAEALKILGKVEDWSFSPAGTRTFTGLNYNTWYGPFALYAENAGLIPEKGITATFDPDELVTRGWLAENIFRSLAITQLGKEIYTDADIEILIKQVLAPKVSDTLMEKFDLVMPYSWDLEPEPVADSGAQYVATMLEPSKLVATTTCKPLDTFKKAVQMLQDSCYEPEIISPKVGLVDTGTLTSTIQKNTKFMGSKKDVEVIKLTDRIEVHLAKGGSGKQKGTAYAPDKADGKVVIELNLDHINCDPEAMKVLLYHELVHEQQLRRSNFGYWNSDGTQTKAVTTRTDFGKNGVDPRTMVGDCMEFEAHLLTARCIQKEQADTDYKDNMTTMDKMLGLSKDFSRRYLMSGAGDDPNRQGCLPYLKSIKDNVDSRGRTISNADWKGQNQQIWDKYLKNWWDRLQKLNTLFYEKFFYSPTDSSTTDTQKRLKFRQFMQEGFSLTAGEADNVISDWQRLHAGGAVTTPPPIKPAGLLLQ
jgi:hypothetical protein